MSPTPRAALRRPSTDAEIALITTWLAENSRGAALSADLRENTTAAGIRAALDAGLQMRLVVDRDDDPVGITTWRCTNGLRNYEFSILIGAPELWLSGVGAEAAMQVVDQLFMIYDAHKVSVTTGAHNPYVSPALARGGFTLDGVLRDHFYIDGEYCDALVWSLIAAEHRALVAASAATPFAYRPRVAAQDRHRARTTVATLLSDPALPTSWDRQPVLTAVV